MRVRQPIAPARTGMGTLELGGVAYSIKGYAAFGLDLLFFILGGALLVYLLYTFGFAILRIDWYILWYMLMMMAVPMVGFFTMAVITAIVAAGLSLVVRPPSVTTAPATQPAFGEAAVEP